VQQDSYSWTDENRRQLAALRDANNSHVSPPLSTYVKLPPICSKPDAKAANGYLSTTYVSGDDYEDDEMPHDVRRNKKRHKPAVSDEDDIWSDFHLCRNELPLRTRINTLLGRALFTRHLGGLENTVHFLTVLVRRWCAWSCIGPFLYIRKEVQSGIYDCKQVVTALSSSIFWIHILAYLKTKCPVPTMQTTLTSSNKLVGCGCSERSYFYVFVSGSKLISHGLILVPDKYNNNDTHKRRLNLIWPTLALIGLCGLWPRLSNVRQHRRDVVIYLVGYTRIRLIPVCIK